MAALEITYCAKVFAAIKGPDASAVADTVCLPHESATQVWFVAADRLAAAVNLDMADWWTATGESYLGRVKKDQAITTISEGTGDNNLEDLRKLKKTELVATAERRLAEKRSALVDRSAPDPIHDFA